jgi:peptidyl-prolyl cis-trans isomerase B (cyclophilin B)
VIIKGLDIVKAIAAMGTTNGGTDGTPKQTIAIEKVSVR